MLESDFHAEMRKRMKENYHLKGGKQRLQIKRYLERYGWEESEVFKDKCDWTPDEKVEELKSMAEKCKLWKKQFLAKPV